MSAVFDILAADLERRNIVLLDTGTAPVTDSLARQLKGHEGTWVDGGEHVHSYRRHHKCYGIGAAGVRSTIFVMDTFDRIAAVKRLAKTFGEPDEVPNQFIPGTPVFLLPDDENGTDETRPLKRRRFNT